MCQIRNQLRDLGYDVHETVLEGADWNVPEHRDRMFMVAVTRGMHFDFAQLKKPQKHPVRLGDYLDPIADDDPSWSPMAGLKAKEVRDKAAGKGFAMQIFSPEDDHVGTMTKGYAKVRSTDPRLMHPVVGRELLRQFTPAEHARFKGIPERLVRGLPATSAHELLGQSIIYPKAVSVGELIGETLQAGVVGRDEVVVEAEVVDPGCSGMIGGDDVINVPVAIDLKTLAWRHLSKRVHREYMTIWADEAPPRVRVRSIINRERSVSLLWDECANRFARESVEQILQMGHHPGASVETGVCG